jgi:hypothetical protein
MAIVAALYGMLSDASQDICDAWRAALVADLPAGVLKGSGLPLEKELYEFLKKGIDKKVRIAFVQLMSRSGSMASVDSSEDAIINAEARGNWNYENSWARMILGVYGLLRSTAGIPEQLRRPRRTSSRPTIATGLHNAC